MADQPDSSMQMVSRSGEETEDNNSPRRTSVDTGREETDTTTIDVSSIAGLITILTVNLHQLESLVQVGPELGPKFWFNIVFIIISIFCVFPLIVIRKIQSETKQPPSSLHRGLSLGLTIVLFTVNLTLQIFNDISAQCTVLFNQQLPPVPHQHLVNSSA
ncbi:uncharacterized protein LOC131284633 [Anopheles ziemanni]|uniref:uncharacterized protein LOC131259931 n=1 Tax=Anopheles coustani TaxID=139045 RepID=UPI002659E8B6|nr:uncharacterized protein LOC131259931 [Anopheles coustani]XP_058169479.1 uncharacterized protein LOC131284633 [Anopheles ziemanni]